MLKEMDIKEHPDGSQVSFSIRFVTIKGFSVFLPRAVATGLAMNLKDNRMRGVRAVDELFNPVGHIYPVRIDNIVEYNSKTVVL